MDISADLFLDALNLCISSQTQETKLLISTFCKIYNNDSAQHNVLYSDPLIKLYMGIVLEIENGNIDISNEGSVDMLNLKFSKNPLIDKDPSLLKRIESMFTHKNAVTPRHIVSLQKRLKQWIIVHKINEGTRKIFSTSQKLQQTTDPIKQDLLFMSLEEQSKDLAETHKIINSAQNTNLAFVDMSCHQSLGKIIDQHSDKKKTGIFKTGLQGINKMFGGDNGFVRGEFIAFAGASHHYKSGILMDMLRWLVIHNDAPKTSDRIPCIVFISLENELDQNVLAWFKAMYVNLNGVPPPVGYSTQDIINFVHEIFNRRGWKVFIYRELGEDFGYEQFIKLHNNLLEQGYDVVASILDYLTIMKPSDGTDNSSDKWQKLAHRIANYGKHKNISVITGLQLNSEADILIASGVSNIVKRFTASHLAQAKAIFRELDICIFLCLEKNHQGIKFLTGWKGKHRYNNDTPEEDRYFAYQFTKHGILDDLNGDNTKVQDIFTVGADSSASSF